LIVKRAIEQRLAVADGAEEFGSGDVQAIGVGGVEDEPSGVTLAVADAKVVAKGFGHGPF
jgi:hypothetical protein